MALRPVFVVLLCAALSGHAFGQAALSELRGLRDSGSAALVYDGSRTGQGDSAEVSAMPSGASKAALTLTGQSLSSQRDTAVKAPPKPSTDRKPSTTAGQVRGSIIGFLAGFICGAVTAWGLGLPLLAVLAVGAAVGVPAALIGNDVGKACALDAECS